MPGGLDSLKGFLDLRARSVKIGSGFLDIAVHTGEWQALTNQMLAGRGKMGVGLVCGCKCRMLACVDHASYPQGHQTKQELASLR